MNFKQGYRDSRKWHKVGPEFTMFDRLDEYAAGWNAYILHRRRVAFATKLLARVIVAICALAAAWLFYVLATI